MIGYAHREISHPEEEVRMRTSEVIAEVIRMQTVYFFRKSVAGV